MRRRHQIECCRALPCKAEEEPGKFLFGHVAAVALVADRRILTVDAAQRAVRKEHGARAVRADKARFLPAVQHCARDADRLSGTAEAALSPAAVCAAAPRADPPNISLLFIGFSHGSPRCRLRGSSSAGALWETTACFPRIRLHFRTRKPRRQDRLGFTFRTIGYAMAFTEERCPHRAPLLPHGYRKAAPYPSRILRAHSAARSRSCRLSRACAPRPTHRSACCAQ